MGVRREVTESSLLRGLTPPERRVVASRAVSRRLAKDETLFLRDEPAESLCQVEAGRLKLSQVTADGQTVTVRFTGPGELCGAMAVLDGGSYPFTAVAVEPTRLLLWSRSTLRDLCRDVPRLEENLAGIVGAHARDMLDRLRELATEPVARRLARALLRLARLGVQGQGGIVLDRIRQQDLAELAAASPYTVNRILADWESLGVLERDRARILVRSEDRLRSLAEPPRSAAARG